MPLVLGAVFCTKHLPIFCLAVLSFAVGLAELRRLGGGGNSVGTVLAALLGVASLSGALVLFCSYSTVPVAVWALVCLSALGSLAARAHVQRRGGAAAFAVASFWIAAPLCAVQALHSLDASANDVWSLRNSLLLLFLPLWAGDTAAILVGKAWGRRPLARSISPNKTVEGAIANLAACIALGWGTAAWLGKAPSVGILCGLVCGLLGQVGDLFESYLKRIADVKDSGGLLPGHGGILDRIDSLLFAAPVVLLFLTYLR